MNPDNLVLTTNTTEPLVMTGSDRRRMAIANPRALTPCRHCGKRYKNVLEHITKSHSWLQVACKEDGEMGNEPMELFWKDKMWKEEMGGWAVIDGVVRDVIWMYHDRDDEMFVVLTRSTTNPTMWVVSEIQLFEGGCQRYKNPNIQVLHKRI